MRRHEMICVVESIREVIAIESTQQYNGTYHVLGGIISPLDGIGPDQLNIQSLISRVNKENILEILLNMKLILIKNKLNLFSHLIVYCL